MRLPQGTSGRFSCWSGGPRQSQLQAGQVGLECQAQGLGCLQGRVWARLGHDWDQLEGVLWRKRTGLRVRTRKFSPDSARCCPTLLSEPPKRLRAAPRSRWLTGRCVLLGRSAATRPVLLGPAHSLLPPALCRRGLPARASAVSRTEGGTRHLLERPEPAQS